MPAERLTDEELVDLEQLAEHTSGIGTLMAEATCILPLAQFKRIVAEFRATRSLLAELEWTERHCGACHNAWTEGHAPGCELAALLGREERQP